jgi:hypothetical protein
MLSCARIAAGPPIEPPHALTLLADDDRRAGILAGRKHHAGRHARVPEHVERDEAIVRRRLGILEDAAELRQVARTEEVRDIAHRLVGEACQRGGVDGQNTLTTERVLSDPRAIELPVRRRVRAVREHVLEGELGHAAELRTRVATVTAPGRR